MTTTLTSRRSRRCSTSNYLEKSYPQYKENLTQAWEEYDNIIKEAEYKVTKEFENIKEEAEAAKAAEKNAPTSSMVNEGGVSTTALTTVFASSTPSFNVSAAGKKGLEQLEHEVLHAPVITNYYTSLVSIEAKQATQWTTTVLNGYVTEWGGEYTSTITDLFAQEFLASYTISFINRFKIQFIEFVLAIEPLVPIINSLTDLFTFQ